MAKFKLAVLKNETKDNHLPWITACEEYPDLVDYKVVDINSNKWLEDIIEGQYDFLLTRPGDKIGYFKQLYDERIYILNKVLNYKIYPTLNEIFIYENKKMLSYYLRANKIPHPETHVFYSREEALYFVRNTELPVVAKTSIGSSGSGVNIIKNIQDAEDYINNAFSAKGIKRSYLPNIRKGDYLNRIKKRLKNFNDSVEYFSNMKKSATIEPQKWFVIFQEYVEADYEWRCVVIDDSFFGHKKVRTFGEKLSGTAAVSWDYPDEELLNLLKNIMEKNQFWSQAIDLFYDKNKGYLVNEMQCFWGSKNPHQMIKDGEPGRFIHKRGQWIFEKGEFNLNNSYNLRLKHIIKILQESNGK